MLPKIHSLGSAPRDLSQKAGAPRWTAVEVNSMFQSQRTLTLVAWYVVLLQDLPGVQKPEARSRLAKTWG